jgi:hypothetical protein
VPDIDLKQLSAVPTATGQMARYAYARARKAKIELAPLLKQAGLQWSSNRNNLLRVN